MHGNSGFSIWNRREKDKPHPLQGRCPLNCFYSCPPPRERHKASRATLLQGHADSVTPSGPNPPGPSPHGPAFAMAHTPAIIQPPANPLTTATAQRPLPQPRWLPAASVMHKAHTASGPLPGSLCLRSSPNFHASPLSGLGSSRSLLKSQPIREAASDAGTENSPRGGL